MIIAATSTKSSREHHSDEIINNKTLNLEIQKIINYEGIDINNVDIFINL